MKDSTKKRFQNPDMSGLSFYHRLEALFYLFLVGALGGFLYEEIYCLIDSAAVPGQVLDVVDERWIFPNKLNENEIWN